MGPRHDSECTLLPDYQNRVLKYIIHNPSIIYKVFTYNSDNNNNDNNKNNNNMYTNHSEIN